jgi:hypothetical protein
VAEKILTAEEPNWNGGMMESEKHWNTGIMESWVGDLIYFLFAPLFHSSTIPLFLSFGKYNTKNCVVKARRGRTPSTGTG